jgi:MarR family transcriptional regulator, transcriptional regulator for hemolysin
MLYIRLPQAFVQETVVFNSSRSAGHLVSRAARRFVKEADRGLKPLGLSSGYIPVFFALAAEPVLSQKALVLRAAIEQPTMAATLVRMERDGLVERTADPADARASLFRLTAPAKAKLPCFFEILEQGNTEALMGLDAHQRDEFLDVLTRIIDNLSQAEPRPARAR